MKGWASPCRQHSRRATALGNRNLREVTADPQYPVRIVPAFAPQRSPENGVEKVLSAIHDSTDKLKFVPVKFIVDGSIQGFTARLKWPGYFSGQPNGLWLIPPGHVLSNAGRRRVAVLVNDFGDINIDAALIRE